MNLEFLRPIFLAMLHLKYVAMFLIMFLDNTILPFPGETLLIFAGYLIYLDQMNFWLVVLTCALGSLAGSALMYETGRRLGEPAIEKYGRFVFLNKQHLRRTYAWFDKRGSLAVFYSRFIPGIGHLVSLPAGAAKMSRPKFLFFSFAAAFLWYGVITYLCVLFSRQWDRFFALLDQFQSLALAFVVVLAAILLARYLYRKNKVTKSRVVNSAAKRR